MFTNAWWKYLWTPQQCHNYTSEAFLTTSQVRRLLIKKKSRWMSSQQLSGRWGPTPRFTAQWTNMATEDYTDFVPLGDFSSRHQAFCSVIVILVLILFALACPRLWCLLIAWPLPAPGPWFWIRPLYWLSRLIKPRVPALASLPGCMQTVMTVPHTDTKSTVIYFQFFSSAERQRARKGQEEVTGGKSQKRGIMQYNVNSPFCLLHYSYCMCRKTVFCVYI